MDTEARLRALQPLWSWLPAFRAVAETEHLPSAGELCGTGPSSLSRALSLLERHVGKPLFTRSGRSLTLNDDGRLLLDAVRDAMRRVDDGLEALRGGGLRGTMKIASGGAGTTALVAPALERLRDRHPDLMTQLVGRAPLDTPQDLLRGRLDVAFQEAPLHHRGLTTLEVGRLTKSVYCGPRHPLFERRRVARAQLVGGEFLAPPPGADGVHPDGWPTGEPRRVVMLTDQLRVGLELCIDQPLLAVLPDVLAARHENRLRRLQAVAIDPSPVFAVHRRVLGPRPSAAAQLAELVLSGSRSRATDRSSRP